MEKRCTPDEIIEPARTLPKPKGIYWDEIDEEKIESIPVLRKLGQIIRQRGL